MSFDLNNHKDGSSKLTANLTKRRRDKPDRNGDHSNGLNDSSQMVPKIRVVSGGYEPVTVIQEDRSSDVLENGDAFGKKDDHKLENGALVERNFENDAGDSNIKAKEETSFGIAFEVLIPFLIAGLGTVGAGLLLDKVQVLLRIMSSINIDSGGSFIVLNWKKKLIAMYLIGIQFT